MRVPAFAGGTFRWRGNWIADEILRKRIRAFAFARKAKHGQNLISTSSLRNSIEPIFWVMFLLAVSGGFFLPLGGGVGERIFWLLGDAFALGLVALAPAIYLKHIFRNLHLFSWPLIAMLSSLWSLTPGLSFYHGAQLLMTMLVGLVLRERFGLAAIAKLVWAALAIALVFSLAIGIANVPGTRMWHGEWMGIFAHKNMLGAAMTLLIYTSAALAWSGWRPRLCSVVAVLALYVLLMSRSGGAIVTFLAVAAACVVLIAWRSGLRRLALLFTFIASGSAFAVIMLIDARESPLTVLLDALGKDTTLSGRTVLWDFGMRQVEATPILGVGYKAFWETPATSSAYLRHWMGQDLWTFHNNFIDVLVALGAVGLIAFAIGLAVSLANALIRFSAHRSPINAWALLFLVHVLLVSVAEDLLFYNHSLYQVLLVIVGVRLSKTVAVADTPMARMGAHLGPGRKTMT
jgi:exopolysaccharide production protein ExoQ